MKVLEIGGGLSGFQFVLDRAGCDVVNVDPGMEARGKGWPCDEASMRKMNAAFGTHVLLRNCTIDRASLEPASFDRAFSISVLEHLPEDERDQVMRSVFDCLKPNGLFILTVDLFLNLAPFTRREQNEYGDNVDIRALCRTTPFERVLGDAAQLFGFPEFDPNGIQARLEEYVVGQYPALVQCLILKKPGLDVERPTSVAKASREEITS